MSRRPGKPQVVSTTTEPVLDIRHSTIGDGERIRAVVTDAFSREAEALLVTAVREAGDAVIELSAFLADELVGHILLSPIRIEPHVDLHCLGIAPVSVLTRFHGRGIGSALMGRAIEESKARSVKAIFLLGAPAYYHRFGFQRTHIGNEYGANDAFMALALEKGCLDETAGTARYVKAFSETGT